MLGFDAHVLYFHMPNSGGDSCHGSNNIVALQIFVVRFGYCTAADCCTLGMEVGTAAVLVQVAAEQCCNTSCFDFHGLLCFIFHVLVHHPGLLQNLHGLLGSGNMVVVGTADTVGEGLGIVVDGRAVDYLFWIEAC